MMIAGVIAFLYSRDSRRRGWGAFRPSVAAYTKHVGGDGDGGGGDGVAQDHLTTEGMWSLPSPKHSHARADLAALPTIQGALQLSTWLSN